MRAYSPELAEANISVEDFVSFIDGLNEAFIASPILQATGLIGGIMSMVPVDVVQLTGFGVQVAAGIGSAALSYARTRAYVQTANRELFNPRGLHCSIMTTKKMTSQLDMTPEAHERFISMQAGGNMPLENDDEINPQAQLETGAVDPRLQRLIALQDYVAPLETERLPERVAPTNPVQRMNAAFAARQEAKQIKKLNKERSKGSKKQRSKLEQAEKERQSGQKKVDELERKLTKLGEKTADKLHRKGADSEKRAEIEKEFRKEMRKLVKEVDKESRKRDKKVSEKTKEGAGEWEKVTKKERRIAHRIRWIVISPMDEQQQQQQQQQQEQSDEIESELKSVSSRNSIIY